MKNFIYYKFICIDEQHAIIAEQQLNNSKIDKLKSKRLGRAVADCKEQIKKLENEKE